MILNLKGSSSRVLIDRAFQTSCQWSVVTMCLSNCIVSEISLFTSYCLRSERVLQLQVTTVYFVFVGQRIIATVHHVPKMYHCYFIISFYFEKEESHEMRRSYNIVACSEYGMNVPLHDNSSLSLTLQSKTAKYIYQAEN